MDFDYTESEQSFRQEVQDFLRENLPPKKDRDRRIRWRTHRTNHLERRNGTR